MSNSPVESLARAVRGRTEPMLAAIRDLVEINSHTPNKAGGDAVATRLVEMANELGLVTQRVTSTTCADHLILSTPRAAGSIEGGTVFVGHHDTVFPPGTFEGFRVEGGIARGPGVLDMKGGIVVMLESLRAIKEAGLFEKARVRIVLVGDEEVGSPEGKAIIEANSKGAARALVFEAGRAADKIITARKGTGSAKVIAKGKAAHAANNHKDGVNAIWALACFIDRVQRLTDYERGVTVNVGLIKGGEAKNTVPDLAECQIDFRFEKIADAHETFAKMKTIAEEMGAVVPGAVLEVTGGPARMPLERTAENGALFELYAKHAGAAGLGNAEASLISGGSDASTTSAIGIPSIDGMGPRGSGFHTKEELIEVASLEPKVLALATLLAEVDGG